MQQLWDFEQAPLIWFQLTRPQNRGVYFQRTHSNIYKRCSHRFMCLAACLALSFPISEGEASIPHPYPAPLLGAVLEFDIKVNAERGENDFRAVLRTQTRRPQSTSAPCRLRCFSGFYHGGQAACACAECKRSGPPLERCDFLGSLRFGHACFRRGRAYV